MTDCQPFDSLLLFRSIERVVGKSYYRFSHLFCPAWNRDFGGR